MLINVFHKSANVDVVAVKWIKKMALVAPLFTCYLNNLKKIENEKENLIKIKDKYFFIHLKVRKFIKVK